jgi:hypothetical protein
MRNVSPTKAEPAGVFACRFARAQGFELIQFERTRYIRPTHFQYVLAMSRISR